MSEDSAANGRNHDTENNIVHHDDELGLQSAMDDPNATRGMEGDTVEVADSKRFENYELIEEIGRGSFGVVYQARQLQPHRIVALKLLNTRIQDPVASKRFLREAEIIASLEHPFIVRLYDVVEEMGEIFFSMQYVDGGTLADAIETRRNSLEESILLMRTIASTVDYAHSRGVLHRDLKPQNILISSSGEPFVTDFGLARIEGDTNRLSLTGDFLGTPAYVSPEQAGGIRRDISVQSDVFSLGAILYAMLTGRPPFVGPDTLAVLLKIASKEEARNPRELDRQIPQDLASICLKALAKERQHRYRTAAEFEDDLRRFQVGEAVLARPLSVTERGLRYVRQNPLMTAFVATVCVAMLLFFSFLLTFRLNRRLADAYRQAENSRQSEAMQRYRAEESAKAANEAESLANEAKLVAEKANSEKESEIYRNRIAAAQRFMALERYHSAKRELAITDPKRRDWEWDFLFGELNEFTSMKRLGAPIDQLFMSDDGSMIAAHSFYLKESLHLLDRNLNTRRKFETGMARHAAVSPDFSTVAIQTESGIQIFDGDDWQNAIHVNALPGNTRSLVFLGNTPSQLVRIYELPTTNATDSTREQVDILVEQFSGGQSEIDDDTSEIDGPLDSSLTWKPIISIPAFEFVSAYPDSDQSRFIVVGKDARRVILHSIRIGGSASKTGGAIDQTIEIESPRSIRTAKLDRTGKLLSCIMADRSVIIFRIPNGEIVFQCKRDFPVLAIDVDAESEYVLVGKSNGLIEQFAISDSQRVVRNFRGHGRPVLQIHTLPDRSFVSSSHEGSVCHWNPSGPKSTQQAEIRNCEIKSLSGHPTRELVVSCEQIVPTTKIESATPSFRLCIRNGRHELVHSIVPDNANEMEHLQHTIFVSFIGPDDSIRTIDKYGRAVTWKRDGTILSDISLVNDSTDGPPSARILNASCDPMGDRYALCVLVQDSEEERRHELHVGLFEALNATKIYPQELVGEITHAAFASDSDKLATLEMRPGGGVIAGILNLSNGQHTQLFDRPFQSAKALAISADADKLFYADNIGQLFCIRTSDGERLWSHSVHSGSVFDIVLSKSGKRLFSASEDGAFAVWDSNTGGSLLVFQCRGFEPRALVIAADGKAVFGSGDRGNLLSWRTGVDVSGR